MVLDLAISLISSLPSPLLHGLATIFLSLISPPIGLQIHPRLEMGRTWGTPSVVTRPPLGGKKNTGLPSCCWEEEQGLGKKNRDRPSRLARPLSLGLIKLGKKEQGFEDFIWVNYTDVP
ncbi:hypothetical protein Acr_17g0002590 [Actinidia rufa]|uniref:Uncharacterized protein n=1 Tax=Actinidia rufa TaxID=165716 RepID=A0A7J0G1M3_9ERIC|nr:hypothetical protein Acr_17g0002590 [Actinidia rufa]